jgi:hypothetical protein
LHHGGRVTGSRAALGFSIAAACAGCFYTDPINDAPRIDSLSRVCAGSPCDQTFGDVHRGDTIQLAATFHDPDGPSSECRYAWTAIACNADLTQCDTRTAYAGGAPSPAIHVPSQLEDSDGPVQWIRVTLELFDGRGAHATEKLDVEVNEGPALIVRDASRTRTVGGPIVMFATYGDPDGAAENVTVTWTVAPPPGVIGAPYTKSDPVTMQDPDDPAHLTSRETIVPMVVGEGWDIAVTATDAFGQKTVVHAGVDIAADTPPCIAALDPIVAPDGAVLPISAPTRFAVPLVTDDLDPYPALAGEPLFGTSAFQWSILPPGAAAWQPLAGAVTSSFELDPSAFVLGDRVGVRVEVEDRNRAPVTCDPAAATCGTPSCVQRQTWQVEAR